MTDPLVVGRRKLLVLGAAASVGPACSSASTPLGAPGKVPTSGSDAGTESDGSSSAADGAGSGGGDASGSSSGGNDSGGGTLCSTSGGVYAVPFSQQPSLMTVGQGVVISGVPGHPAGVWVEQSPAGTFIALDLSCTHAGCPVSWQGSEFRCPCHGAVFSETGVHVSGPGYGPLASLSICADATGVYITP
jgi:Rieske Fe-S protein